MVNNRLFLKQQSDEELRTHPMNVYKILRHFSILNDNKRLTYSPFHSLPLIIFRKVRLIPP